MASSIQKPFAIVEFDEKGKKFVSVVSVGWLSHSNTRCAWPTGPGSQEKLINHAVPDETYTNYPCSVLKYSGSFKSAKKSASKARTTDKLESSEIEVTPVPKPKSKPRRPRQPTRKASVRKTVKVSSGSDSNHNSADVESSDSEKFGSSSITDLFTPGNTDSLQTREPFNALNLTDDERISVGGNLELLNSGFPVQPSPDDTNQPTVITEDQAGLFDQNPGSNQLYDVNVIDIGTLINSLTSSVNELRVENQNFQRALTDQFVEIKSHQLEILRRTGGGCENPVTEESDHSRPTTPLATPDDLDELNEWLQLAQNKTNLIGKLRFLGGRNANDVVTRILSQLLSDKLAKIISLTGAGKCAKRGLKDSKLQEVLYDAVRFNRHTTSLTNSEIDEFTKKWLKNAKDRDGGRQQRSTGGCSTNEPPNGLSVDTNNGK